MAYNYGRRRSTFRRTNSTFRRSTVRRVYYTRTGIPYIFVNGRRQYLNR